MYEEKRLALALTISHNQPQPGIVRNRRFFQLINSELQCFREHEIVQRFLAIDKQMVCYNW